MNIKEGDMFILSQNKEKLYNLSGHIEGIGYEETKEYTKWRKFRKRCGEDNVQKAGKEAF